MRATETPSELRLGLVGPVFPFRGGVARHTTQLKRELEALHPTVAISFCKLYPRRLYPGRDCIEPGYERHHESNTTHVLSSLNPATWRRALNILLQSRVNAVILPWWTSFLGPCHAYLARRLSQQGVRVVLLCHNTEDHDPGLLRAAVSDHVISRGQAFVTHTRHHAERLRKRMPSALVNVYPHPVFEDFPAPEKALLRRAPHELLFFGLVRQYKGLDTLIEAIRRFKPGEVFLTVAGEWWLKDAALKAAIRKMACVELLDYYIPEHDAADLFARADTVVLPYRAAAGTGVIPLAYRYDKPVIASGVGGLIDAVDDGISGLLVPPGDAAALADAIRRMAPPSRLPQGGVQQFRGRMTFAGLAHCVAETAMGRRTDSP